MVHWFFMIRELSSFQRLISYCERDILGEWISVLISGVWIEGFHCTAVQLLPQLGPNHKTVFGGEVHKSIFVHALGETRVCRQPQHVLQLK